MKYCALLVILLFCASCNVVEFSPDLTRTFSIRSASTGGTYSIKVALPENFSPQSQKYATLYVLDGEENYDFVADQCKKISNDQSTANVLVVSIGYGNDRTLDYTPSKAAEGGGGAEDFVLFLNNELRPKLEADFAADTSRQNRVILGHSFGGLLCTYAFTVHNEVFGNYIILSPSLWYDDEIMLRLEQEHRAVNTGAHHLVFMGLGELESDGRMLAPYVAWCQRLQGQYADMRFTSHIEPDLYHRGSEKPNITEGLKYYFRNR
jgi:hypothetical protein